MALAMTSTPTSNKQIKDKNMKKNKWILLTAAALTLGACSSEGEPAGQESQQPVEIKLSSSLYLETRAYTKAQDSQIESGEKVYAWVDEVSGSANFITAWQLTASGTGGFAGASKNYPMSGYNIDVYAIHGNFIDGTTGEAYTPTGDFPSTLTHSVAADQGSATSGYANSDLLFTSATGLARQVAAHPLTFSHLLTKIEVYLVAGTGFSDSDLASATVRILNTKPATTVTLDKSATPIASVGTVSGTVAPITAKMSYGSENVTVSGTTKNAPALAEAVIVPQSVESASGDPVDFIEVTISSTPYTAQLKNNFTAGNRYVYNVVVNKSGIQFTSSIDPWGPGVGDTINAQ